jgi:hypothetical protein
MEVSVEQSKKAPYILLTYVKAPSGNVTEGRDLQLAKILAKTLTCVNAPSGNVTDLREVQNWKANCKDVACVKEP